MCCTNLYFLVDNFISNLKQKQVEQTLHHSQWDCKIGEHKCWGSMWMKNRGKILRRKISIPSILSILHVVQLLSLCNCQRTIKTVSKHKLKELFIASLKFGVIFCNKIKKSAFSTKVLFCSFFYHHSTIYFLQTFKFKIVIKIYSRKTLENKFLKLKIYFSEPY